MLGEDKKQRGILKGYIFEIAVLELLQKNGFTAFIPDHTSPDYDVLFKEERAGFVELRGRGSWHQIDCPCDYHRIMPFCYPMRILGEVKYHGTPIKKQHVREYIGVLKDIQENWIVAANSTSAILRPRLTEIGVFFSASGFDDEAEHLAYAHGIKTISYANNHFIANIKNAIDDLEANHLTVKCLKDWSAFRKSLITNLHGMDHQNLVYRFPYWINSSPSIYHTDPLDSLRKSLDAIKTTFFATTSSGVVLQFLGSRNIPSHLFENTDHGKCKVYYTVKNRKRYYWMEFTDDNNPTDPARFYFTPPESLDQAAAFGGKLVLDEKKRIFKQLSINIEIENKLRSLIITLDNDWFEAIHK